MDFQEYPKWVYPAGILDNYEAGQYPFVVQDADEEAALTAKPKRGRKVETPVEAE